jgi:hypothetical protein
MFICKHCNKEFIFSSASEKANHSRWCTYNPNRQKYLDTLEICRNSITKESTDKRNKSISNAHKNGAYKDSASKGLKTKIKNNSLKHTEDNKQKIREKALASNHRRLCKSVRDYICRDGTIVKLDSSWEEALAKRLDELQIKWIRPNPLKWKDECGIEHNYFPDFYLTDYNLFLDPKNPIAFKSQETKITILKNMYSNIVFILSLEECILYKP